MPAELNILIGLSIFLGLHILTGLHEWRQAALNKIGLISYRILFSIGTLYAFWTILKGFDARPFDVWWDVPVWASFAPFIIMPLSIFFLTCHFMGRESDGFTRQPIGWAIVFWALSHLLANGESGTIIFFIGFFLYGILALYLRERKASLGDCSASHGSSHPVKLVPFTRWPSGMSGKKIAFLLSVTALVDFFLIYIHDAFIGLSALPAMIQ